MDDVLALLEGMPIATFKSGEALLTEGVRESRLYILIDGEVEVIRRDTLVSHVDEPGSIFGEMSVLLDQPHSATVQALSPVRAYQVDDAIKFLEAHPELSLILATLLARRLYYTTSYLVDLQQQAQGKREDLDIVDNILSSLTGRPRAKKRA
ncbi:Crp/Fnr family transcriptional regulator [Paradevosia shaoguanensis]|uniref:Crp/Fnr family transcriptional regulator n=1 Tax=Paradevosia shaoguanensis TaxID=1335043 RepID=UPI0015F8BB85|nr:cyclic nucleotide-binding domain-containing protein [Paradevosia shaoguanensis]QMV03756.1 cyclic nucleotide-binding domain-containing protein [Devosia sp. D6-9]